MDILEIILLVLAALVIYYIFKSREITYYISPSPLDPSFVSQVSQILRTSGVRKTHTIREVNAKNLADIIIELQPRDKLTATVKNIQYYPGTKKRIHFSYTWQLPKPYIAIDSINWLNGVPESGLTISNYRRYVIQHEFMHALGYDHVPCDETTAINGVCPILYQATRGCPTGFKCGHEVTDIDYKQKISNSYF